MVTFPILNSCPSVAIIASNSGLAFGPYTIGAPDFLLRSRWPETKSA
jgi:hypothetical protein